jgi:hypothetical protein
MDQDRKQDLSVRKAWWRIWLWASLLWGSAFLGFAVGAVGGFCWNPFHLFPSIITTSLIILGGIGGAIKGWKIAASIVERLNRQVRPMPFSRRAKKEENPSNPRVENMRHSEGIISN